MGVTIHYRGTIANPAQAEALVKAASAIAAEMKWKVEILETPFAGLTIFAHPDCEPLALDPDSNGLIENWVKTQFAGPKIHVEIVDFLSGIAPYFEELAIEDEAEFWETRNPGVLKAHMEQIDSVLRDMQSENPGARIKVQETNGRIVDMIR